MKILLTNDDGIEGAGLWAMAHALSKKFEIVISAPMTQQSGMAHALTFGRSVEFKKIDAEFETWAIDGTPTDCVKIYMEAINREKNIGAVISGINDGANLATDVLYSGTVGAALEGFLHDIPALAISRDVHSEIPFSDVAEVAAKFFAEKFSDEKNFFYNLNFPKKYRDGKPELKNSRLGRRDYINAFKKHTDETGRTFYKTGGEIIDLDESEGTDIFAVRSGFVAVTPLDFDVTNHGLLQEVRTNKKTPE